MTAPVLDRRALNRAYLARQWLLGPRSAPPLGAVEMVEHLVGLQSQNPNPPYVGLWSRLEGFRTDDLADRLLDRSLVRASLMRGTIHLVSATDARVLRRFTQPFFDANQATHPQVAPHLGGVDLDELVTVATELLTAEPLSKKELRERLGERWPDTSAEALVRAANNLVPQVHVPPRGIWGATGQARTMTTASWTGTAVPATARPADVVRRYLGGYGPASVLDAQQWSGVGGLEPVFESLRPQLRVFRNESGRELFDLPDAPRPDPDTPAPVRLVAEFDTLTLAHADRSRIVADADRTRLMTVNGIIHGTVLVDGFVEATWKQASTKAATIVTVEPFGRLTKRVAAAIEREGAALAAFTTPGLPVDVQVLAPPG